MSLCIVILISLLFLAACGTQDVEAETDPYSTTAGSFDPPALVGFVDESGTTLINIKDFDENESKQLSELINIQRQIAIFSVEGNVEYSNDFSGSIVEIYHGRVNFSFADGRLIENIAGIIADPPDVAITQVYYDALRFLSQGERVMVVVLDGWGWEMYHYFAEKQPFLANLENVQKAHSVFPPFTPVAMSSILTGTLPNIHGVHDRSTRIMAVPDLFQRATDLGFTSTRIQGGVNIVQTSTMSTLIPNLGDAHVTDQRVFDVAMAHIVDTDLLFIHFNAIDDWAHNYGPYSPQAGESIAFLDSLIGQLVEARGGVTIVTADHGQHFLGQLDRMGDHLWISHEDMFVPYIIIKEGR